MIALVLSFDILSHTYLESVGVNPRQTRRSQGETPNKRNRELRESLRRPTRSRCGRFRERISSCISAVRGNAHGCTHVRPHDPSTQTHPNIHVNETLTLDRDAKLKIKQAVAATADARKEMQDLCEKIKKVQESLAAKRFEMDQNSTASATDPATKKRYETQVCKTARRTPPEHPTSDSTPNSQT